MTWGYDSGSSSTSTNTTCDYYGFNSNSTGGTYSGTTWYNTGQFWQNYNYLPEKFKDKHEGMLLEDFLAMWRKDNFRIIEIESKEMDDGNIVKRFNVYSEKCLNEYGNHLGFVVVVGRENRVLDHQIFNIRGA